MNVAAAILTGLGLGASTSPDPHQDSPEGEAPLKASLQQTNSWLPWVRSVPEVPFSLDIPNADIKVRLVPRSFETDNLPWYAPNTRVEVAKDGNITSHLKVRDNRLLTTYQSLLEFYGISFENLFIHGEPDRLMAGSCGGLHAIIETSQKMYEDYLGTSAFLLLDSDRVRKKIPAGLPFIYLNYESLPLGTDYPYICEEDSLPIIEDLLEYPSQENPKLDFDLTRFLPGALTKANNFLSNDSDLNELIPRIFQLIENQKNKDLFKRFLRFLSHSNSEAINAWAAKTLLELSKYQPEAKWKNFIKLDTGARPEDVLDLLKEGEIELNVGQLADFYWSGLIDLGQSSGKFRLGFAEKTDLQVIFNPYHKVWHAAAEDLNIHIESIKSLPWLKNLKIKSGVDHTLTNGDIIEGGIHTDFDPGKRQIDASANLNINAELNLPFLGRTETNFNVIFKTQLQQPKSKSEEIAWAMVPKQNTLVLDVRSFNAQKLSILPTLTLDFNDRAFDTEGFQISLKGNLGDVKNTQLSYDGILSVKQEEGFYHWQDFILQNQLKVTNGQQAETKADFKISSPRLWQALKTRDFSWLGVSLAVSEITHNDGTSQQDQDFTLREGVLEFLKTNEDPDQTWQLFVSAEEFEVGTEAFRDARGSIRIEQHNQDDGKIEWTGSLNIAADSQRKKGSKLQGPLRVSLKSCDEDKLCRFKNGETPAWEQEAAIKNGLRVLWDPKAKAIAFEDLNLFYQVWGLPIPEAWEEQQIVARREKKLDGEKLGPIATGTMAQGAFTGHYTFNLTDLKGDGNVGLDESYGRFHSRNLRLLGHPAYKQTHLRCTELNQIRFKKGYAVGECQTRTVFDGKGFEELGLSINGEIDTVINYKEVPLPHMPKEGLEAITLDYYRHLSNTVSQVVLNPELTTQEDGTSSVEGGQP